MDNLKKLTDVFRETFSLSPKVDVAALSYRSIREWDSVGHIQLVAAIESAFDVMLESDDILDMSSLAKAVEILRRHDVQFAT